MELQDFFKEHPKAALAYSGGVDSAYLLYAGLTSGGNVRPYYVKSQFQPAFEQRDALRLAKSLGVEPVVLELDVLACPEITSNPEMRCYHCKRRIMEAIRRAAAEDGYTLLLDGTNASDQSADRPGMRALEEAGILSPLRLCGLTKPEIRALSRAAGLFTWDKPAYACLATRIPTGEEIDAEKLEKIEKSEDILFSLGFSDFRVRLRGENALLQFTAGQLPAARKRLEDIKSLLGNYFEGISIDPEERKNSL